MGVNGGSHPTGLTQRSLSTLFLRCAYEDFSALAVGIKEEFRMPASGARASKYVAPTPVVLYATSPSQGKVRSELMVLSSVRRESLGEVAYVPGGLEGEGFETYKEFQRYWRRRTHRPYRPLDQVDVFTLARWGGLTYTQHALGLIMLNHLYGEHLP